MSYSNGPRIITDSLVFCIDPVSSKNSGSTIRDLGPQNCNGTLTNGASISSNYFLLDGTNDYIDFTTNNIISNTITVDIWFYVGNTNNNLIICAGDNAYNSASWNWGLFVCCSQGVSNNLLGLIPNSRRQGRSCVLACRITSSLCKSAFNSINKR